jgi:hypothetical protein
MNEESASIQYHGGLNLNCLLQGNSLIKSDREPGLVLINALVSTNGVVPGSRASRKLISTIAWTPS